MSTLSPGAFHKGELAMRELMGVYRATTGNPTQAGLPPHLAHRAATCPLMAVGVLDAEKRPWVTLWGNGRAGEVCAVVAEGVLGIRGTVDAANDPVIAALFSGRTGQVVRPDDLVGGGSVMACLAVDLATRDRVKLGGWYVGGVCNLNDGEEGKVGEVQMAMKVRESLGNCPKYINRKAMRGVVPEPVLVEMTDGRLGEEATRLLGRADMIFLSSWDGAAGMDVNHRGGRKGFVRVRSAEAGVIVWPEYSGNRLYQTLGNFHLVPVAGMVVPDYETGDVLYLTGTVTILHGPDASAVLPHSKLAIQYRITRCLTVLKGLPFRSTGELQDPSPYNPPVWSLRCERERDGGAEILMPDESRKPPFVAVFRSREQLSSGIARFTFRVSPNATEAGKGGAGGGDVAKPRWWEAGQHVTMDFSRELDMGYSHMNDDDPGSLNDDYVRTFTVSSPPPRCFPHTDGGGSASGWGSRGGSQKVVELDITARKHGPVTNLLWRHMPGRENLEVPVLGFGGQESFRIGHPLCDGKTMNVFVAGGIGITPLLAQTPGLIENGVEFEVLWSVRAADLGLVRDSVNRTPGLGQRVRLFVTGHDSLKDSEARQRDEIIADLIKGKGMVQKIEAVRMEKEDVLGAGEDERKRKFFCCMGPEFRKEVEGWLAGEETAWEDFGY